MSIILDVNNVSSSILSDVNFKIKRGTIVGLVG